MSIEISLLISFASVLLAAITGITNLKRNNTKDVTEDATQMATVLTELKGISSGIDEIKKEITSIKDDVKENRDRTTRLEESCKQAHKRIDELITRLEHANI